MDEQRTPTRRYLRHEAVLCRAAVLVCRTDVERGARRTLSRGGTRGLPAPRAGTGKDAPGIFRTDVAGIDWADALVAIMDGPDPDSGTAWECGYAFGKKPILLVRTDFRAQTGSGARTTRC